MYVCMYAVSEVLGFSAPYIGTKFSKKGSEYKGSKNGTKMSKRYKFTIFCRVKTVMNMELLQQFTIA